MTPRSDEAAAAESARTITALLGERVRRTPAAPAQWRLGAGGTWAPADWSAVLADVAALARALRGRGIRPGDRVAIMASGRAEWDIVHLAVVGTRAVAVGIDPYVATTQADELFALAQPVALVVDDVGALSRVGDRVRPSIRVVVFLDDSAELDAAAWGTAQPVSLRTLLDEGRAEESAPWDRARADDVAWLIFTSGTTGRPKALAYRHGQVCAAVGAILDAFADIAEGSRLVSWLPLSNPFQRIINLCAVARGAQTYYVADPRDVMRHLPAIRPHVFIAVPRFFEKVNATVTAQLEQGGRARRRVGQWALGVGERWAARQRAGQAPNAGLRVAHRVADALVLRRVRAAFGGELRYAVSGSAAMPQWLLGRMHAMGVLVLEAYGLSECIVPVAANRPGAFRFGSVGRTLRGVQVRVAADGELMLRSEGICERYFGDGEEAGRGLVDCEGWLTTGDFAEIDAEGFVRLIGRKSEVFKTSTGRRIAPAAVEALMRAAPGVEHAAVFGAGRPSLLAVLVLSDGAQPATAALQDQLRRALAPLPEYQRPAGAVVSRRPFTVEGGELTGNLKLRRHRVGERYAAALSALAAAVDSPPHDRTRIVEFEPGAVDLMLL